LHNFLSAIVRHPKSGLRRTILWLSDLRAEAKEYFAERWEPTNGSYPPLIDALHDEENCSVKIIWKPDVLSEQELFNQRGEELGERDASEDDED
jgi:hypothetical protein